MSEVFQNIGMRQIRKLLPVKIDSELGDDLFVVNVPSRETYSVQMESFLKYPCRTDAYMAFFCKSGSFQVEVNLRTYSITRNSLFISMPNNMLKLVSPPEGHPGGVDVVLLAISPSFLSSINIDISKIFGDKINLMANPVVRLDDHSLELCSSYVRLVEDVVKSDYKNKKESVGSLVASLFYLFVGFLKTEAKSVAESVADSGRAGAAVRANLLFDRFIKLVTEYHNTERNMAFYSKHIGLTPKYLSKLIKQASGRSAPDWIDSFVVLEAKNLLKYTDKSIKEIVYELHFPNPSVFYKFFKAHTGMTPSQYRDM